MNFGSYPVGNYQNSLKLGGRLGQIFYTIKDFIQVFYKTLYKIDTPKSLLNYLCPLYMSTFHLHLKEMSTFYTTVTMSTSVASHGIQSYLAECCFSTKMVDGQKDYTV